MIFVIFFLKYLKYLLLVDNDDEQFGFRVLSR